MLLSRDPHRPAATPGPAPTPDAPPDAVAHATGVAFSGAPARPARAFLVLLLAVTALVLPGLRAHAESVMPARAAGALHHALQQADGLDAPARGAGSHQAARGAGSPQAARGAGSDQAARAAAADHPDGAALARRAYATVGVPLPASPHRQWTSGPRVGRDEWQPGDLVFHADDAARSGRTVTDVAVYAGGGQVLHVPAPGQVRLAPVATAGLLDRAVRPAGRDAAPLLDVGAGTRGDAVRDVQHRLRANGYDVPVTGTYDAPTRAAVAEFQRRVGVPADGVVRRATWGHLVRYGVLAGG